MPLPRPSRRIAGPVLAALLLAAAPARAEPAPAAEPDWPSWLPRTTATVAVYGSLAATAISVRMLASQAAALAPASVSGAVMAVGVPLALMITMRNMVPMVTERVPPAVLAWFGVDPLPPSEPLQSGETLGEAAPAPVRREAALPPG